MNTVITGATKGIGKAIANLLAQKGHNLAICARSKKDLQAFVDELSQYDIKVIAIEVDLSDSGQIAHFCNEVRSVFHQIDVFINNAGVFMPGNLLDEPDASYEYQTAINMNAAYYLSKFFGKIMRQQRSGHIFNICSVASKMIVQNAGSYSVTKAAMLSLNDVLRLELAPYNVKVTSVLPGSTLTASWEGTTIDPDKFVQPEDIAELINATLNLSVGANVDEIVIKPLNF